MASLICLLAPVSVVNYVTLYNIVLSYALYSTHNIVLEQQSYTSTPSGSGRCGRGLKWVDAGVKAPNATVGNSSIMIKRNTVPARRPGSVSIAYDVRSGSSLVGKLHGLHSVKGCVSRHGAWRYTWHGRRSSTSFSAV